MGEKTLFVGVAIALGSLLFGANVFAEEVDCMIDPANEACVVTTSEEPVTGVDDLPVITSGGDGIIFAGEESDEAGDVEIEEEEIVEEPALWPMYLSLGALGAAILTFIILSICSPKLKK